ncbi:TPA: hypothetical protein EYP27_01925 [Candidatus Bathyarchaeota archaeon]|nr:hypothetical protein [Candidatus Bathyarchaeota archaeon]
MRELLEEILVEATPYLQNPEWLRWRVSVLLGEQTQLEKLAEALEEAVKAEADPTKRTDLKIFLQYLKRRSRRLGKT